MIVRPIEGVPSSMTERKSRVLGLDSIRFVCAIWVFWGHGAAPVLPNPFPDQSVFGLVVRGIYRNLWNGPAAVIVFFVISGFCIHYPYVGSGRSPCVSEFYARRFLRLLIPVAIAIPLSRFAGVYIPLLHDSILWSLVAELIYYFWYPALRLGKEYLGGWGWLVFGGFSAAVATISFDPFVGNYPSYGFAFNWLVGLPCWLLGCVVAERIRSANRPSVSFRSIWYWRGGVLSASWFCSVLRFHGHLGYPWTLNAFAILVAAWLIREISYRRGTAPIRAMEWAGTWSYSLYLFHVPAMTIYSGFHLSLQTASLAWIGRCLFVFACCYAFYFLIERPSHTLARAVGFILSSRGRLNVTHPSTGTV